MDRIDTNFEHLAIGVLSLQGTEAANDPQVRDLITEAQRVLDFITQLRLDTREHCLLRRQAE